MGRDGSDYVSNQVNPENAALGFRVKSGWAAVVLLTSPIDSPRLRDSRVIDLCDPRFPETRQPYHAAMGKLETDAKKTNRRTDIVHPEATAQLKKSINDVRRTIRNIGRFTDGPWGAEQKLAAVGAWVALCHKPRYSKRERDEDLCGD